MKIGIAMFPTIDAPAPDRLAQMIENRGLESLWFAEHSHLPVGIDRVEAGDGGDRYAKTFDPFVAMTAAASATTTLKVATGVCLVPQRDPIHTAKQVATVDVLSDGRVILGVGAGFKEREFLEYGYEFPSAGRRVADLAESLPRIKKRLAALNPPPVGRMPILIAGGGEQKMLRIVAEHADIWNTFAEGDDLVRKLGLLRKYCAEIGRDPSTIEYSVHVGGDPRESGPALRELGVSLFTTSTGGPDYDLDTARQWIAWRDEQNA